MVGFSFSRQEQLYGKMTYLRYGDGVGPCRANSKILACICYRKFEVK